MKKRIRSAILVTAICAIALTACGPAVQDTGSLQEYEPQEENVFTSSAEDDVDTNESETAEQASVNKDGSYTVTSFDGTQSADVSLIDGQICTKNSPGHLSTKSEGNSPYNRNYRYSFEALSEEELIKSNTDVSWMQEYPEEYSNISVSSISTGTINGRNVSWCSIRYTYENDYLAYNYRILYGWTKVDEGFFQIEIDDMTEPEAQPNDSAEILFKEAFGNVIFHDAKKDQES